MISNFTLICISKKTRKNAKLTFGSTEKEKKKKKKNCLLETLVDLFNGLMEWNIFFPNKSNIPKSMRQIFAVTNSHRFVKQIINKHN